MTIEELLNLPDPAWESIGKMTPEELAVYLKDVTEVEPRSIPAEATPCTSGEDKDIEELIGETSDSNPIKLNRKKKDKKTKGKAEFSKEEIDDILSGLS